MSAPSSSHQPTVLQPVRHGAPLIRPDALLGPRQIGALDAVNPLVSAANPLLITAISLRSGGRPSNVESLRQRLTDLVRDFRDAARKSAISDDEITLARYALCALLDEAVQNTEWASRIEWAAKNLLSENFPNANDGGRLLFEYLERMLKTPDRFPHALPLYYICLSLGFMGMYAADRAAGKAAVDLVRSRVYLVLKSLRPETDRTLSDRWHGVAVAARQFRGFATVWFCAALTALVCLCSYVGFAWMLAGDRAALQVAALRLPEPKPTASATANPAEPRLKPRLKDKEDAGQLRVEETRLWSRVTLLGGGTFESGSAVPGSGSVELFQRVAQELKEVRGSVHVKGHTDNVPVRTHTYASNRELSLERARMVAEVIKRQLSPEDRARVSYDGVGDAEPLPGTRGDAAVNRRVEITLFVPAGSN